MRRHRHIRRVDLQVEAGVDDRAVLIRQRLGARGQVFLVRPVVLIWVVERDLPRAHRAHERFGWIGVPERP
jgi:hypothetical protein